MDNTYDVKKYTDADLLNILDLANPTDAELEAKILYYVNKYNSIGNSASEKLTQFFVDIYNHFFVDSEEEDAISPYEEENHGTDLPYNSIMENMEDMEDMENEVDESQEGRGRRGNLGFPAEGFETISRRRRLAAGQTYDTGNISGDKNAPYAGFSMKKGTTQQGQLQIVNTPYQQATTREMAKILPKPPSDNVGLTKTLDYAKDNLNPLLKQTIKRVISIDSQYRENKKTITTEFTFNLSEPLRDVVSLKLYSVQIPFTWYTVSNNYGGNFFYLKGNSPGINNGSHDYKVSITPGNYNPFTLIQSINDSISLLRTRYTDVNFGSTAAYYNQAPFHPYDELTHGRSSLRIEILKIFNQSNYYLEFPNWSTPTDSDIRTQTLAGYMGFNETTYNCFSIYSERTIPQTTSSDPTNSFFFTVDVSNRDIHIVTYLGDTYETKTAEYNNIKISLDIGPKTRSTIVHELNTKLKTNPYLDAAYSFAEWIDIVDPLQSNVGNSYIQISVKLNRNNTTNLENLQSAVIMPNEISLTPVWVGENSCLRFQDYINELNDLIAETPALQTNYIIEETNQIKFECIIPGYTNEFNTYTVDLLDSVDAGFENGYILSSYLTAINDAILTTNQQQSLSTDRTDLYGIPGKQTYVEFGEDNYVRLYSYINRTFTEKYYVLQAYGRMATIFGLSAEQIYDLSDTNIFTNLYTFTSISLGPNDKIIISPKTAETYGNHTAAPWTIVFNSSASFSNRERLRAHIATRLNSFVDPEGKTPFQTSTVQFITGVGYRLTLHVIKTFTQNDYRVVFQSTMAQNSWTQNLKFNATYNLSDYSDPNFAYNTVRNNLPLNDNQIDLIDGSNNYFYIRHYNIDGLETEDRIYDIPVVLPGGTYSRAQLYITINQVLDSNYLTHGSYVASYTYLGVEYTLFHFNINKVYGTKDYRLVFYDPFSFVSCIGNAAKGITQSIQNTTWDTTIGWILGFRENIEYMLGDYADITYYYEIPDFIFYLTGQESNVCCLTGDTTVTTNLYSYFLIILDDYVQNHLNDGLVTITPQETTLIKPPTKTICDPVTGEQVIVPADYNERNYTEKELFAFNQIINSQKVKTKSYSKGPFIKDIFGLIPIKTSGLSTGSVYVEFGGTLQNQERVYFGPVNINRMTIRLMNDRGDLVDLNGSNWSFSLVCEQLYKS
jgi:hypothetical protein